MPGVLPAPGAPTTGGVIAVVTVTVILVTAVSHEQLTLPPHVRVNTVPSWS